MAYLCRWSSKSRGIEKTEGKGIRQSAFECISMSSLLGYLKPRFLTFYFGLRFSFWFLHRQFALDKCEIHGWKFTNLLCFTIWWMSLNHITSFLGNLTIVSPHEDIASESQNCESPGGKIISMILVKSVIYLLCSSTLNDICVFIDCFLVLAV